MRLACLLIWVSTLGGQPPPISAIAAVTYRVSNLARTREYYRVMLGFPEAAAFPDYTGKLAVVFLQINDTQFTEFEPRAASGGTHMPAITLASSDLTRLHELLKKRGVNCGEIQVGFDINRHARVTDPDGNAIDLIEYVPGSTQVMARGRFDGAPRVVNHLRRAALQVRNIQTALAFYRDRMGLIESPSQPGTNGGPVTSVNMQIPGEGHEYLELVAEPGPAAHAIAFDTGDLQQTLETLTASGETLHVRPAKSAAGQLSLNDPDGNRIQFEASKPEPNR
jgi:catechol 2,3-dioxygenase-like lactoylglutathione lyase family enzyme